MVFYEVIPVFFSCKMQTVNPELINIVNDCLLVVVTLEVKGLFIGSAEMSARGVLVFLAAMCDCSELCWL